ncbi:MAG: hypothetical protein R6U50_02655 [Desulfobacterales bacterium]
MSCFLWGCTGQRIPYELVKYVNQDLQNLSRLETRALSSYASVIGDNYTTDERVGKTLKQHVIPYYKRFTELLRDVSPGTNRLRRIHSLYVHGADKICHGFNLKMLGIEKKDENLILIADRQIAAGRNIILQWQAQIGGIIKQTPNISD